VLIIGSNTTVALFIDFARATAALRKIVDAKPTPPAYAALEAMDQSTGCKIAAAADLCLTLTHGLGKDDGVIKKYGRVESVSLDEDGVWSVTTTPSASARRKGTTVTTTPLLVLATGSQPAQPRLIETYPHLSPLDLDVALSPTRLAAALPRREPMKIALVGASHSAILVLRNLYELASSTHPLLRIKWFSRHPLRYAVNKGDWILRDNTGLKGETRLWAKKNLEDGAWEKSDVKNYVEKIFTTPGEEEKAAYDKHLNSWDVDMVCEAIGFERSALPEFTRTTSGTGLDEGKANVTPMGKIEGDALTGALEEVGEDGEVRELKGLKGVGVAWPERVTDKEGNVESAVGLWKFMKYLKRVVPEWAKETRE
jgi:alpha-1,3/alpha-1,6-mannosyltransferase